MLSIKTFVFNPFGENTYILYNAGGDCAVVDPGNSTPMENQRIASFIDDNHLTLHKILITHAHVDHVAGVSFLVQRYGAEVLMHPDAMEDFSSIPQQAAFFGFGSVVPFAGKVQALEDDGQVTVGESILEVLCTPGHAQGSVSLYAPVEGWSLRAMLYFAVALVVPTFPMVILTRYAHRFHLDSLSCLMIRRCSLVMVKPPLSEKRKISIPFSFEKTIAFLKRLYLC